LGNIDDRNWHGGERGRMAAWKKGELIVSQFFIVIAILTRRASNSGL
jgi:hypothetical protein